MPDSRSALATEASSKTRVHRSSEERPEHGTSNASPKRIPKDPLSFLRFNHFLPTPIIHPHLYTTQNPSGWHDLPCHPFPGGVRTEAKLQQHAEGACWQVTTLVIGKLKQPKAESSNLPHQQILYSIDAPRKPSGVMCYVTSQSLCVHLSNYHLYACTSNSIHLCASVEVIWHQFCTSVHHPPFIHPGLVPCLLCQSACELPLSVPPATLKETLLGILGTWHPPFMMIDSSIWVLKWFTPQMAGWLKDCK